MKSHLACFAPHARLYHRRFVSSSQAPALSEQVGRSATRASSARHSRQPSSSSLFAASHSRPSRPYPFPLKSSCLIQNPAFLLQIQRFYHKIHRFEYKRSLFPSRRLLRQLPFAHQTRLHFRWMYPVSPVQHCTEPASGLLIVRSFGRFRHPMRSSLIEILQTLVHHLP